jgi:hypothetical protein
MARKLEEINQEYGNVCAQLGDRVYQAAILGKQIDELRIKLGSLQDEGLVAVEEAKQAAADAAKEVSDVSAAQ